MVAEMERRLAKGNYNVGFYVASCPKNGAEVPWSGLSAMLRVLCGVQEGDDEAHILEVLPRLRALGPGAGAFRRRRLPCCTAIRRPASTHRGTS